MDPVCSQNSGPISLLAVGYKVFSAILFLRLQDAGAEGRIWPTQFGFRSGCCCMDAHFHCKAECGKCVGPETRKLASAGPGLGQSFRCNWFSRFGGA